MQRKGETVMSKYTVHMMGIMYFHVCTTDVKEVLVPDGTQGKDHIPPHLASLFVDKDLRIEDTWWVDQTIEHEVQAIDEQGQVVTKRVFEFRVPRDCKPVRIEFLHQEDRQVEVVNLDQLLPMIGKIDPEFQLDLEQPAAIARVPIRKGRLEAFAFNGGRSAVQWTFEGGSKSLTIAGVTESETKSITVRATTGELGSEIVFSNTPNLLPLAQLQAHVATNSAHDHHPGHPGTGHTGHDHHFQLYRQVEKHRDGTRLVFPSDREDLPFGAHYLKAVSNVYLDNSCTPTCCT
jgi:hypothetical protein